MTGAKTPILHGVAQGDIDMAGYKLLNLDLSTLASGAPFSDATALIKGSGDVTKLARFEIDGFTAGALRVFTLPNYDAQLATLAGTEALTNKTLNGITFSGPGAIEIYGNASLILNGNLLNSGNVSLGIHDLEFITTGVTSITLPTGGFVATTDQIPIISDVAYNATTWNANLDGASKNAIRDKFESLLYAPFDDDKALIKNAADNTRLLILDASLIATGVTRTLTAPNKNGVIACISDIPDLAGIIFSSDEHGRTLYVAGDVSFFGKFTIAGGFDSVFNLTAATDIVFPVEGTLATRAGEETLTNKTINEANLNSTKILSIRSSGADFDLAIETAAVLTAGRKLILALGDANRTLTLGGNFSTVGAFPIQFTATALTSVVLPLTGTLSTLAGAEAFTNKTGYNGVKLYSGTGSPESVVTAPVGSFYSRTDGGANTTLYVKESGALAVGWIAK